jgi:hypothetical protein
MRDVWLAPTINSFFIITSDQLSRGKILSHNTMVKFGGKFGKITSDLNQTRNKNLAIWLNNYGKYSVV